MRLVVFGLTISSSWGNGHATLWRGLGRALADRGHEMAFFERDVSYYSQNRDLFKWEDGELILYSDWQTVRDQARAALKRADAVIITSFCPDALLATDLVESTGVSLKVFYDLDTPVTLAEYRKQGCVFYIPSDGLRRFDLVISFTGGLAMHELKRLFGARKVATLYGHVDPKFHRPSEPLESYRADLSYLGTFASDRQPSLDRFFVAPARSLPVQRFLIGGALYPASFPWAPNIYFVQHVPPSEHPAFFASSRLTLNVTRPSMAEMGYCPSGRLFEAASCQTPILSDYWPGLEEFFRPGEEILLANNTDDVAQALSVSPDRLQAIGTAGRNRVLTQHTSAHRAKELEELLYHF
ncbi:MAG: glycosyltransferase [Verrucomicrobia bacterium]|nr:glycosyltransferase [Verrucomicrobiota bacterium]